MQFNTRIIVIVAIVLIVLAGSVGAIGLTLHLVNGGDGCQPVSQPSPAYEQLQRHVAATAASERLTNLYSGHVTVDSLDYWVYAGRLNSGAVGVWRELDYIGNGRTILFSVNTQAAIASGDNMDTQNAEAILKKSTTKHLIACARNG